jgi:VacB/RNase II family 3'-5' exoribonuclease
MAKDSMSKTGNHFDLHALARERLQQWGFLTESPADALAEAARLNEPDFSKLASEQRGVRDLTNLFWSSIDNDTSRDLDQIEYVAQEPGGTRLYVGIADIVSFAPRASALDRAAAHNTTSIYTGVQTFPMFPDRLSTNLTSLLEGETRLAYVVEMLIDASGATVEASVYRAAVHNRAQLAYHAVGAWLEGHENSHSAISQKILARIRADAALQEQLRQQDALAQLLRRRRLEAGALTLETIELEAEISEEGGWSLSARAYNRANDIIEDFMIAANGATVGFLQGKNYPSFRRVVRTPKDWPRIVKLAEELGSHLPPEPDSVALEEFLIAQRRRDPERFPDLSLAVIKLLGRGEYAVAGGDGNVDGHFALAVERYAHTTAPNRRYPDVITQRLLEAALGGRTPSYDFSTLTELALHCSQKEHDAKKAERSVYKSIAAVAMSGRVGETFDGMITGAAQKGVWVRICQGPPVEGRLQASPSGLAVGDRVQVRLVSTDPWRGFIDFQLIKKLGHR